MALSFPISMVICCFLLSCTSADSDNLGAAKSQHPLSTENRLVYNRLVYNRLVYNRLVYNRLVYNRLPNGRLLLDPAANDMATPIEATAEGRELLAYIARCAFADSEVLVAQHAGHTYEFPGLLGLAPEWADSPLALPKQRRVSACLLAHVNAFGVSVMISLRADGVLLSDAAERQAYPVYEATFFGQVFGNSALRTYVCQGDDAAIAQAHSMSRMLRVCADGGCQMTVLGRCRDVCERQVYHQGWIGCYAEGVRYDETISTYLHADDPDGENETCGAGENCRLSAAPATAAILDCSEGHACEAKCKNAGTCTLDGAIAHDFKAKVQAGARAEVGCLETNKCDMQCQSGADCELECLDTNTCKARCQAGSVCTIDCRGADDCDQIRCDNGASCLLTCGDDASDCEFHTCPSGAVTCSDGTLACNYPCP